MKTQTQITAERIENEISSFYNPMIWLSPKRLCDALDAFQYGDIAPAARIFEAISRRDDIVRTVVAKRHGGIARLDWEIVGVGDDKAASERQTKVLSDFFNTLEVTHAIDRNKRGCVPMLVRQMMLAVDNKFSVHEIIWKPSPSGLSAELRYVPLWFFENKTGKLQFLEYSGASVGIPMEDREWLVCVAEVALMEPTSVIYYAKNGGWKNWLVFAERYGFPLLKGKCEAPWGSKEYNEFYTALQKFRNGYALLLSGNSDAEIVQANGAGAPFERIVANSDRAIAALWRGSDLGTLSSQNGAGATLQGDETSVLEEDDAQMIEESIEHNLSRHVLEYYFGEGVPTAAKFILHRTDKTNIKEYLDVTERCAQLGVRAAKKDVRQTCRIAEATSDEELIEVPQSAVPMPAAANSRETSGDLEELSRAMGEGKSRLLAELDRIETLDDVVKRADALANLEKHIAEYCDGGKAEAEAMMNILKRRITDGK
jgi:Mu-like prophage protein gp29